MLLKNEIKVGEIYAWNPDIISSDSVTRIVRIIEDRNSDCARLTVECVDSLQLRTCGEHCLTTIRRCLSRLNALEDARRPEEGNHEQWSYDRELKYLREVKSRYEIHVKTEEINGQE